MILAWLLLAVCVVLLVIMSTFLVYLIRAGLFTVPYVPTSSADLDLVLAKAKLKKGMRFVDLGCGDGRLIIRAVQQYGVYGIGTEINPVLIWFAKLWAKIAKAEKAVFLRQDLYSFPLDQADVVYLFLFPRMMPKISEKIKKECKKGTLIISRGFELPGFKKLDTLPTKTFETFFYRV